MELILGDNFLKGLDQIGKYLPNVGEDTNWLNQPANKIITSLSNPNTFPERIGLGGAGNYISSMARNGVDVEDISEFIRQYQFGNNMPGMSPQSSLWENFLSKGNIAWQDIKDIGKTVLGKGTAMGVMLPPNLDELGKMVNTLKMQNMGGT